MKESCHVIASVLLPSFTPRFSTTHTFTHANSGALFLLHAVVYFYRRTTVDTRH